MASRCCVPSAALQPGRRGPCLPASRLAKALYQLSPPRRRQPRTFLVCSGAEEVAEVPNEGPSKTSGEIPSEAPSGTSREGPSEVSTEEPSEVSSEDPSNVLSEGPSDESNGGFFETIFGVQEEGNAPLPANYNNDPWDGEKWEWLGAFMNAFIPIVIVCGLIIGGLAASFYNEGARVLVKGPTTEGEAPELFVVPDAE